jgi:hypothetical protein
LTNRFGKFELKLSSKVGDFLERLKAKLASFKVEEDGSLTRTVERSDIESALDELVSAARTLSIAPSASKP